MYASPSPREGTLILSLEGITLKHAFILLYTCKCPYTAHRIILHICKCYINGIILYIGNLVFFTSHFFLIPTQGCLIDLRERERNTNVREKHLSVDQEMNHNLDMCPEWKLNSQPFGVWDNGPTNWAIWPGLLHSFKNIPTLT